ncbi:MAG: hypothetical protein QOI62_1567 [Solirubrobacteraceae bacterium]|jgi:hypothetical protein|nr:hypothetical protein [Solirubrobacteraceae bacterium]
MPAPSPAQRLQQPGGTSDAPLVAPLIAALAGEVEGLSPTEVLANATKLSVLVRDLTRSLRAEVATVEFASAWDLEAAGAVLDWSGGFPPRVVGGAVGDPAALTSSGRGPALLDAVGREVALLGDEAVVAASVTGPVAATDALPALDVAGAARLALAAVRALCDAGAGLVWVVEDGERPPADAELLARACASVFGTARFYRATAALHLRGAADGWLEAVRALRQAVPCFDADASPALAAELGGGTRPFGLIVGLDGAGSATIALAKDPRCRLLVHDGELAGRRAARELHGAVAALRELIP